MGARALVRFLFGRREVLDCVRSVRITMPIMYMARLVVNSARLWSESARLLLKSARLLVNPA